MPIEEHPHAGRQGRDRTSLLEQCARLLDRAAVKLDLTPLGCALDVDFLETVVLFVGAVQSYLEDELVGFAERDTLPPSAESCGNCGNPLGGCPCV